MTSFGAVRPRAAVCKAALATRHGKERVLAPLLERELGIEVVLVDVDTDRFGTFTRDVPRAGSQLEAARAKARAAIDAVASRGAGDVLGLASEGAFGPHPTLPFVTGGVELVLLVDPQTGIELEGVDVTLETNHAARVVEDVEAAFELAAKVSFPSHALVVMPFRDEPDVHAATKGIVDERHLREVVAQVLATHGRAHVETDMRAHLNPTRMQSIARAAEDLVRNVKSLCPRCARPGFRAVETVPGIPCEDCGAPTARARARVFGCVGCGAREERPIEGAPKWAPASHCALCNP